MFEASRRCFAFCTLAVLAGCATPHASPVAISQPNDAGKTCQELQSELVSNEASLQQLLEADKQVSNGNAVKVVASAIPIVGLAAAASIDLSNVEQVKYRSLRDRDDRLRFLAHQKGCSAS
jgi:hypothetical protein